MLPTDAVRHYSNDYNNDHRQTENLRTAMWVFCNKRIWGIFENERFEKKNLAVWRKKF
jgi:argonaute-like protein implicated in RNA metabolism and viral defense